MCTKWQKQTKHLRILHGKLYAESLQKINTMLSPLEYSIVAILAFVSVAVVFLSWDKQERSVLGFLIWYGIGFLIITLIFWLTRYILG